MGTLFLILTIALSIFVVMFTQFNDMNLNLGLMYTDMHFQISFFALGVILYATGIIAGVMLMLKGYFEANKQYLALKRRLEKTSVGADDSDLRVRTLENKIKTLETALEKTLNKEG